MRSIRRASATGSSRWFGDKPEDVGVSLSGGGPPQEEHQSDAGRRHLPPSFNAALPGQVRRIWPFLVLPPRRGLM
jgi:hypothetical protein